MGVGTSPEPWDDAARLARARTLLFAPASSPRRCAKAWTTSADAVIVDLEDAVAPPARAAARDALPRLLERPSDAPLAFVRINHPGLADGERDLAALAGVGCVDAIVVPKADRAAVEQVSAESGRPVVALLETAAGILDAARVAAAPGVAALMLGPLDLAAELGVELSAEGTELATARGQLVLASAAAGLRRPIDGPSVAIEDERSVHHEAVRARDLGFGGKACIHPRQLEVVAAVFAPDGGQITWARRVVAADAAARQAGQGAALLDGRMIDAPVVRQAQELLGTAGPTPTDPGQEQSGE